MLFLIVVLSWAIRIFVLLVFIRVILSWLSPYPTNSFSRFFWTVTEPVLRPIRRSLPFTGGIDLSPLVVWLAAAVLLALLGSFTG